MSAEVTLEPGGGLRNSLAGPARERGVCRARTEARSPRSGRWPGADVGLGHREEAHGVIPRHREHGGGRWPCGLLSRWQNPASGTARDRDHGRLHLRPGRLWDPSSPAPWPAVSQGERNEPRDLSLSRQECPVRTQGSSAGWHLPQGAGPFCTANDFCLSWGG